jgi:hypothetical protein
VNVCRAALAPGNFVDHYTPEREHMPSLTVWHGVLDAIEGLMQTHLFVKTEGGQMVPRAQAVLRPSAIRAEFIPDQLLGEVTEGRKHFIDSPWRLERGGGSAAAAEEDELLVCPMELILLCAEKVVERGGMDDRALGQLWAYLATEVSETGPV